MDPEPLHGFNIIVIVVISKLMPVRIKKYDDANVNI